MSGYAFMADVMRNAAESADEPTKGELERKAALYDFLGNCTQWDICALFDSSAFNEIAKGYLRRALSDLQDDNTINSDQAEAIRARFAGIFDEMQARQVLL